MLADRPNPTRFDHLNPARPRHAEIEQVIADLTAARVRRIVVSDFWLTQLGPARARTRRSKPGSLTTLHEVARYGAYRVLADGLIIAPSTYVRLEPRVRA